MLGSSPPPPRKKFTLKLILAWIAVALSGFVLLGAIFAPNSIKDALGTAIVAISIGLPGVWYLIHSRRKSHGAPPLKHHWGKIATTSIVLFFVGGSIIPTQAKQEPALPSPSTSTTAPTTKATTSSTRSTTSSTSSVSTASSTSTEPSSTTTKEAALPAPASEIVDERPVGFAGVPDRQPPTPAPTPVQQFVAPPPPPVNNPPAQQNYVHPGAFCNGGSGISKRGVPMTCAPGKDGRNRWKSAG
ncbi:Hypothetical protein CpCap5W_0981 [Corynebacterium pseudotuberculosis]|nr:hypothetical protein CP1002_04670 [Corynebacterium pseudotuberculosis 1002]AEP70916.1 Hypothetical protein Cp4202_1674 [Corynebacterium pseudotuberculosis 42/02-A]AEX40181.1 Hypothetical protein Cp3995_1727 [Corynebacterium pseudotuberculosis 3/99-5]AFH52633.1 Hypothetical protein Cp267_1750 [Corynebacterium pseudotuberculosis 267]AJC14417.1 Hypothetical protein CpVD57_1716 [Corynebacterium pseudotuberculosis]QGW57355.1 hypothetical protein CPFRC_08475 [Corynebacterium pseudotuberculosis FR